MFIRKILFAAPILMLGLAACGGEPASGPSVKVTQTDLGPVLTDQSGRALYGFTKDKESPAACDADCVAVWPAFAGKAVAGQGAQGSLLGEAKPGEGAAQVTYNGWPLYYYVGDAVPGEVTGAGVDDAWFPVAADGALVKKDS